MDIETPEVKRLIAEFTRELSTFIDNMVNERIASAVAKASGKPSVPAKRRGRPPKEAALVTVSAPPKRRGRPPKPVDVSAVAPKRKGRQPQEGIGEIGEKIKTTLLAAKGNFLTGDQIAKEAGVSRSCVSVYIAKLRDAGVEVKSKTRLGYRIGEGNATGQAPAPKKRAAKSAAEGGPKVTLGIGKTSNGAQTQPAEKKTRKYTRWSKELVLERLQAHKAAGDDMGFSAQKASDPTLFAAAEKQFGSYRQALQAAKIDV